MNLARTAALALLFFLGACEARARREGDGGVANGDGAPASRELVELTLPGPLFAGSSPFAARDDAIQELEARVRALATDDAVAGLFLRVGPLPGAWTKTAELGHALARVRAARKVVHCHVDVADGVAYTMLATHCDRLTMTPAGHLDLVGAAMHVFFARTLLASIGVQAEILHVGRYKGTGDSLTLDQMPDTMREAFGAIVDEVDGQLLRAIGAKTGLDPAGAAALVDRGPFDGESARRARLVDALEFDDEARARAKTAARATRVRSQADRPRQPRSLMEIVEELGRVSRGASIEGPRIALVRLEGPIVDGERQIPGQIRSEPTIAHLRALADDVDVKAVVLRIESPGGSVIASDRIWHAVRRVASRKPVIASIGSMGASGGYYVASGATEIFALDTSLVGSIGVVAGKADASALLARVGITPTVVSRRAHAGQSLARPWTDEERANLQASMQNHYDRFVARIVAGRGLDEGRVREAAEGRLWTGRAARERGLVQTAGGLHEAIARARTLAHMPEDAKIDEWPRREGFLERLVAMIVGDTAALADVALAWADGAGLDLTSVRALVDVMATSPVLAALPYVLEIR